MVRTLLVRGMLVGLVAGLLVFAFARVFGEPLVDRAIGFEAAMDDAKTGAAPHEHEHEPELVSRETQAGLGLLTGVVVYATAFGGLFALVFAAAHARAARVGPRATAALLAVAGFVAVYLVPNLKYPANPPAVGEADTIATRTALYFTMLGISVAAAVAALAIRRALERTQGPWNAALIAGALYVLVVGIAAAWLPGVNEVPAEFPATVLWQFRLSSLGMQAVMWTTLGLGFGLLAERALVDGQHRVATFPA